MYCFTASERPEPVDDDLDPELRAELDAEDEQREPIVFRRCGPEAIPKHLGALRQLAATGRFHVERAETDYGDLVRIVAKGIPVDGIATITIELLA